MTWFKVDDSLAFHPKVIAAGNSAMGLWVRAGSWSAQQLTDGFVPEAMVVALGGAEEDVKSLVYVGLWEEEPGGWRFHEWNSDGRQPTKVAVQERRAKTAAKVADWRKKKAAAQEQQEQQGQDEACNPVTYAVTTEVTNRVGNPTRNPAPDPTRPDPTREEPSTSPSVGGSGGDASQQAAPPKRARASDRGTRLPEGWVPKVKTRDDLRAQYARPDDWWRLEHEKFTNHYASKPGKDGRHLDWDLTFRNWIHKAVGYEGTARGASVAVGRPSKDEQIKAALEQAALMDAANTTQQTQITI